MHSASSLSVNASVLDAVLWTYGEKVHGPLGVVLCVISAVLNLLCCLVLRRRQVLVTGNCPLVALSLGYLFMSFAMLPLLVTLYCIAPPSTAKPQRNTYANMMMATIGSQAALTVHTISLWLGVFLAAQRLLCIRSRIPLRQNRLLSSRCSTLSTCVIVLFVVAVSMPSYFMYDIQPRSMHPQSPCAAANRSANNSRSAGSGCEWPPECTYFTVVYRSVDALKQLTVWLYVVQKVLPCTLMTALSVALIVAMRQALRHRQKLAERHEQKNDSVDELDDNCKKTPLSVSAERLQSVNRKTTRMLNLIILLMVFTQLPPAILVLVSNRTYKKFGDLFDTFSTVNNMMNFMLYCKMSAPFRREFVRQFRLHTIVPLRRYALDNATKYSEVPLQTSERQRASPPTESL